MYISLHGPTTVYDNAFLVGIQFLILGTSIHDGLSKTILSRRRVVQRRINHVIEEPDWSNDSPAWESGSLLPESVENQGHQKDLVLAGTPTLFTNSVGISNVTFHHLPCLASVAA